MSENTKCEADKWIEFDAWTKAVSELIKRRQQVHVDPSIGKDITMYCECSVDSDGKVICHNHGVVEIGYCAGDICWRNDCQGILEEHPSEGSCSCHINAPCSECCTNRSYCPVCGWEASDEEQP